MRVPGHRALVDAAVAAGRHVYCEWPLGVALADAEGMADRARGAGVRTEPAGHTRVRRPELVDDEGGTILDDTPDVVVAVGATADDALLSLHVAQGTHADETTRITIAAPPVRCA